MVWLPDDEKCLKICLFILTECTNVTDTRTDKRTDRHHMTAKAALDASIARQKHADDILLSKIYYNEMWKDKLPLLQFFFVVYIINFHTVLNIF